MAGLPEFDLALFTPYRLTEAAKRLSEELASEYRSRFGITIPEWRVLAHLAHSGGVSVRDIEARAGLEKYTASRAASRLSKAGYIVKHANAEDRRLVTLALTEKGNILMAKLLPLAMNYQTQLEARLGDAFEGLESGIARLLGENEK